jgi:hypothetical protein
MNESGEIHVELGTLRPQKLLQRVVRKNHQKCPSNMQHFSLKHAKSGKDVMGHRCDRAIQHDRFKKCSQDIGNRYKLCVSITKLSSELGAVYYPHNGISHNVLAENNSFMLSIHWHSCQIDCEYLN